MSVILKHCSIRILTKFRCTSNTSKLKLSIFKNSAKIAELDPELDPEQLAEPLAGLGRIVQQVTPVSGKFLGN
jgi:hypothetical protein